MKKFVLFIKKINFVQNFAAGRHPIAGMAAAFAGVSGGYSVSLYYTV